MSSKDISLPSVEALEEELQSVRRKRTFSRVLKSTFFSLLVVAAVAVIVAMLFLPVLQLTGSSMEPTLNNDEIVAAFRTANFKTGDIIAFYFNNNILVKRVIANSGDWVDIDKDGNVTINGTLLDEPYLQEKAFGDCNIALPYQVPEGRVFVMGDNRATSIDSRNTAVGCVSSEMVVGKLLLRVWPLNTFGLID